MISVQRKTDELQTNVNRLAAQLAEVKALLGAVLRELRDQRSRSRGRGHRPHDAQGEETASVSESDATASTTVANPLQAQRPGPTPRAASVGSSLARFSPQPATAGPSPAAGSLPLAASRLATAPVAQLQPQRSIRTVRTLVRPLVATASVGQTGNLSLTISPQHQT